MNERTGRSADTQLPLELATISFLPHTKNRQAPQEDPEKPSKNPPKILEKPPSVHKLNCNYPTQPNNNSETWTIVAGFTPFEDDKRKYILRIGTIMTHDFLKELRIEDVNPGACAGPGDWTPTEGRKLLESYSPIDGKLIAKVAMANEDDYEYIVKKAEEAWKKWRTYPAPKRGEIVRQIGLELRKYKEPLGKLVTLEMGKIVAEGKGEVQEMIDIADFAVGLSRQLYGVTTQSERPRHKMYEQWHPLGIVGVITSFNFPVAVWAWNAMIAAVAGDVVVWKPSSKTPLTAVAVQHIVNDVMERNGWPAIFNMVIGTGRSVGEKLINDTRIPLISATGSTAMGKHVGTTVAKRLGQTILELGGNNAIIVMEDADLDMAVRTILFGAVGTAGQRCTTTRRILMHKDIAEELTKRLVNAYKQIPIGDPLDPQFLMGPLVDEDARKNMMDALKTIKKQGGEILYGGNNIERDGVYVEPTIVKMPTQTDIVKHETFAPILYLIEIENIEEAIKLNNEVPQGLSSSIFTNNLKYSELFLSAEGSDAGITNINTSTSGAEIGLAFGGNKETGWGRESGSDSWKAYMRRHSVVINWSDEIPLAQGIKFGTD